MTDWVETPRDKNRRNEDVFILFLFEGNRLKKLFDLLPTMRKIPPALLTLLKITSNKTVNWCERIFRRGKFPLSRGKLAIHA
jgi:hypothetical protein